MVIMGESVNSRFLGCKMDMHNILHEFKFWPDRTRSLTIESAAHERLKIDISTSDLILLKLSSYKDMHKILIDFGFRPHSTTYCGVSCPLSV